MDLVLVAVVFTAQFCSTAVQSVVINVTTPSGLQEHLCGTIGSDTELVLDFAVEHQFQPKKLCMINGMERVTIRGSNPLQASIISCGTGNLEHPKSGFGFSNTSRINISCIILKNCGCPLTRESLAMANDSQPFFSSNTAAALVLNHCRDVTLFCVTVTEYYGYAIVSVNTLGHSQFENVTVTFSTVLSLKDNDTSMTGDIGSGILLYYLDSDQVTPAFDNSTLDVVNAVIANNTHITGDSRCIPDLFSANTDEYPFLQVISASGVTVIYRQSEFNVVVSFVHAHLLWNLGSLAGGMLLLYLDTPHSSATKLEHHCKFFTNMILNQCQGAGLVAHVYLSSNVLPATKRNEPWVPLGITDSFFVNHVGIVPYTGDNRDKLHCSGAIYLSSFQQEAHDVGIIFDRVQFRANTAVITGACIYAETIFELYPGSYSLNITLRDVIASGNYQILVPMSESTIGLFTFINVRVVHVIGSAPNSSRYYNNSGSVIDVWGSNLHLEGWIVFWGNRGREGPALRLRDFSHIFLHPHAHVSFIDNVAQGSGGAVFSEEEEVSDSVCRIQVINSTNVSMIFDGNIAIDGGGNAIKSSSIYNYRQLLMVGWSAPVTINQICVVRNNPPNGKNAISSTPIEILTCIKGNPIKDEDRLQASIEVYAGELFHMTIAAIDAANMRVATSISIAPGYRHNNHIHPLNWSLPAPQSTQLLEEGRCSEINLTILAQQDTCQNYDYQYCLGHLYFSLPDSLSNLQQTIVLYPCPAGFELNTTSGECECSDFIKELNSVLNFPFQCDIQTQSISIKETDYYWIGIVQLQNDSQMLGVAPSCPTGYCNYANPRQWISTDADNNSICLQSRGGLICGLCSGNLSVVFGSDLCQQCSNIWLTTIVLYATLGAALVALLFCLQLTISHGAVNSIIFYAQVANAGYVEMLQVYVENPYLRGWSAFSRLFLSLLNLSVGFPLCFFDRMNELHKSVLLFAFPLYLLSIVIAVVVVSRYSSVVARLISRKTVHVLSTIIYLSFSRMLMNIINVFSPAEVYTDTNSTLIVWFRNGSVAYWSAEHLGLMGTSLCVMTLILLPYTVAVTGARLWVRFPCLASYLKPLLDATLAPYRDSHQHWFGLRLLLLVLIYILFTMFRGSNYMLIYPVSGTIFIAFSITSSFTSPFKNKLDNGLDSFLLANMCILFASTQYYIQRNEMDSVLIISNTLALSVFAILVVVLSYHILIACGKTKTVFQCWDKMAPFFKAIRPCCDLTSETMHTPIPGADELSNDDSNALLREPLLSWSD